MQNEIEIEEWMKRHLGMYWDSYKEMAEQAAIEFNIKHDDELESLAQYVINQNY